MSKKIFYFIILFLSGLKLQAFEVKVHSVTTKNPFIFNVEKTTTILDLKKQIDKKTGAPIEQQTLLYAGERMDNDKTIGDYITQSTFNDIYLTNKSTYKIFFKREKNSIEHEVPEYMTALEIKKQIEQRTGIPPYQQRIILAGKEIEDKKALADYNFSKETTIHFVVRLAQSPSINELFKAFSDIAS